MNKRAGIQLLHIAIFSLVFSLISVIYIFISVFGYVVAHDYIFYELQNLTEELEQEGILPGGTAARTQTYGEEFRNFNLNLDNFWLIAYILFVSSSFVIAYKADRQNYFSFLGILFYGIMIFLFMLTLISTATTWFKDNIMLALMPTISVLVPKFYFYLDHVGIFSAVHLVLVLLINMLDFDFAKIIQKKKQEEVELEDDEVL